MLLLLKLLVIIITIKVIKKQSLTNPTPESAAAGHGDGNKLITITQYDDVLLILRNSLPSSEVRGHASGVLEQHRDYYIRTRKQ